MTLRLTTATPPTVPDGAHPGFQLGSTTAVVGHSGFGEGDHYTLEVRTPGRMHVLPGATTVVWFMAPEADGGWTASAIETAEGLSGGTVTESWLRGQTTTTYGLRSDEPLAFDDFASIGRELRRYYEDFGDFTSPWFMFKAGNTYTDYLEYFQGQSALHPVLVSDYGSGDRPLFSADGEGHTLRDPAPSNNVWQGIKYIHQQASNIGNGVKNWLFSDVEITQGHHGLVAQQFERLTMYASNLVDNVWDAPEDGIAWDLERGSGLFVSRFRSKLTWSVMHDHNGWVEGYNPDGVTWNNGEFGQAPHSFNHNDYTQKDSSDVTYLMNLSTRAPFSADQARSGGYANVIIRSENNAGGNFGDGATDLFLTSRTGELALGESFAVSKVRGVTSGNEYDVSFGNGVEFGLVRLYPLLEAGNDTPFIDGETVESLSSTGVVNGSGIYTDYATSIRPQGNFTYLSHFITMGIGYKDSAVSVGEKRKAQNGLPTTPYTARYIRVANGIDPQNAAEATAKSGFEISTATGLEVAEMANAFFDDVKIHNWGSAANDRNLTGLTPSELDTVTLGGWNDDRLSQAIGTSTTVDALDYLRTLRNPGLLAADIWSYASVPFGDPTMGHTAGATALFDPDLAGDGFRMDGINNWSIGGQPDYPVDGDNCDLDDNLAYNFMTWRFADMDFGTAGTGGVRMYGGFISCTTAQGNGVLDLRESGQFYFAGTNTATVGVTATGGRLGFTGATVGGTIDVALSGQAQVFVQGGASATVRDLTLTGDDCVVGFDGTSGTAALTVTGALHFAGIAQMREQRSGDHGLEDLGGGVDGQPVDPAVTSSVTLAGTCVVTVDTTGLAPGPYDLIDVDLLDASGADLPAGVAVSGGKLILTV